MRLFEPTMNNVLAISGRLAVSSNHEEDFHE
jgi:hypothetical protein